MDLTNMIPGGAGEEKTPQQQLSKEEYAAMKKQQREEVWAEVDAQAQAVFQNGDSLKGFLDFMAQCNTQKTPNLLLIYGQNPEATVVKSYDYWKKEHRSPKSGVHGYTYMVSTEYEKDGEMRTGYAIGKGFDISQMSGKPLEERPQRSMEELIHAVLKDQPVRMQIADNLPEGIQAQYIPKQRTVYVRNIPCSEPGTGLCRPGSARWELYEKESECTSLLCSLRGRQAVWGGRVRLPVWKSSRDAGKRTERSSGIKGVFE